MNKLRKLKIINIHTDGFIGYRKLITNYNLTTTKDQTTQIESFNSVVRSFLPRFHRKTKAYTKSIEALDLTLNTFFNFYNKKSKKYFDNQKTFFKFAI